MPIVGESKNTKQMGRSYQNDPMRNFAKSFLDAAQSVLTESKVDIYSEPQKAMMLESSLNTLRNFFVENSNTELSHMNEEQIEDHNEMMRALFDNDKEALLEYAPIGSFNPVIGMTFPIHKNLLMNSIFDKGAIPKAVATSPKFTISMETRILLTPEGEEIDMFLEQNKMFDAIEASAPIVEVVLDLPEVEQTDILREYFNTNAIDDNLSIESHVSAVLIDSYVNVGETYYDAENKKDVVATAAGVQPVWFRVEKNFVPAYGEYDRQLMDSVVVTTKEMKDGAVVPKVVKDVLSGYVKKNMFTILGATGVVKKVKLACRIDTSTAMIKTCSATWRVRTDIIEIPNAIPINAPISPEEVKDISALYKVNQVTKIMSLFKTVLGNYKDDKIKRSLDTSFQTMPVTSKIARTFDFAPREGYHGDHVEWRKATFMDTLDTYVTSLIQVLNDPNVTITVIGRADLIRKITPTTYDYQTPPSVGAVDLDFVKTVVTSDKRVYQFISSDKLRGNNNLIVVLNPRNSDRIMYQIYDYQTYVSNEIRNAANPALPAIHAFERFKFVEYQPVQARIQILNPTGLRNWIPNTDPIGKTAMNDFDSEYPMGYDPATGRVSEAPGAPVAPGTPTTDETP